MMTIIFIPVSGPKGVGEYMRSLILADAIADFYTDVDITFVLSRQAAYANQCPYPVELVNDSPTKCTQSVNEIILSIKPDIVIFDASGRAAQYRAAKKAGAKVVFISQHKKKRARAFALNRIGNIDLHCITQMSFVDGDFSLWQKAKLKIFNKPAPYFIGPVFSRMDDDVFDEDSFPQQYVFFSSGGGGHTFDDEVGRVSLVADEFIRAARMWHESTGENCVLILGPNYPDSIVVEPFKGVKVLRSLPNAQLIAILARARCAVLGGGAMLSQAIALKVPVVAIPVAKDQPKRINALKTKGLVLSARLCATDVVSTLQCGAPPISFECSNGCQLFVEIIESLVQRNAKR